MKSIKQLFIKTTATLSLSILSLTAMADSEPKVVLETNKGDITILLDKEKAPVTVENFLSYVNEGYYNGVIFHRVIPNFMVQTGGFAKNMSRKATKAPIKNEATNGLSNERGTIAMARTSSINSATSQFFINSVDNLFLDHKGMNSQAYGYAVFGRVTDDSLSVIDSISKEPTTSKGGHQNVPVSTIIIEKAYQVKEEAAFIDASSLPSGS